MAQIHAQCFETAPRAWREAEFESIISEDSNEDVLWAEHGFLVLRVVAGEAEILTIAVAPDARRQRIGHGLMVAGLELARQKGAAEVFLEVSEANLAARALYERFGFCEVGLRKDYYQSPRGAKVSAVVMRCGL